MSKKLLIAAFDEPNHTQTPNALFELLPQLGDAELRVTLVMVRHTLGYHQERFKMGIGKLAAAAGLSEQGARNGAQAAEERGIFRRVNPDNKKEAEWELVLRDPNHVDPQPSGGLTSTTLTLTPNHVDHIPPLKESIKENNKENDILDGIIAATKRAGIQTEAQNEFEAALGFGSLPWGGAFEKFGRWVRKTYEADPRAFRRFAEWRKGDGKYNAMSNKQIRMNPDMFVDTGYPAFLAHTSMYETSAAPVLPVVSAADDEHVNFVPNPFQRKRNVK